MRLKSQPQTISQKKNLGSVSENSSNITSLAMLNPQEVSEILTKRRSHKNVAAPTALWFGGTRGFPRERALRGTGEAGGSCCEGQHMPFPGLLLDGVGSGGSHCPSSQKPPRQAPDSVVSSRLQSLEPGDLERFVS